MRGFLDEWPVRQSTTNENHSKGNQGMELPSEALSEAKDNPCKEIGMKYLLAVFGLVVGLCGSALADGVPLIQPSGFLNTSQETALLSNSERARVKQMRSSPESRQATVISIDSAALLSNIATISIPGKQVIRMVKSREERRSSTDSTWYGKTDSGGEVTIVSNGNKISASIFDSGRNFEIRSLSDKFHVLIEVDQRALPPDHPASHPSGGLAEKPVSQIGPSMRRSAAANASASAGVPNINILIAFTPQTATILGDLASSFQIAVDKMNQSFANSTVNLHVALVGQVGVPVEYSDSTSALSGVMRALPVLIARDKTNADVVVLVAHFADACGVASQILAGASTAFVTVADTCMNSNLSMAHEIGHLLGARHDAANDSSSTPYAYGHGYAGFFNDPYQLGTVQVCWHTIMSYARPLSTCADDPRINYWSNPSVLYSAVAGHPHATGVANSSNVAAVLNLTGSSAGAFHNTKLATGPLAAISSIMSGLFVQDSE